jgi:hypothetical protein
VVAEKTAVRFSKRSKKVMFCRSAGTTKHFEDRAAWNPIFGLLGGR